MSSTNSPRIKVFIYKTNTFTEYSYRSDITCEDVCILCCKLLNILPKARLIFGLRVRGTEKWLTLCRTPKTNVEYEFRMRFKVPDLHKIDFNAYEYLYAQMRHDLVHDRIADIQYPAKKDYVVGFGSVDMLIDYLEHKGSVECIENNYKLYLPKQLVKTHKIFAKKKICEGFQSMRKNNCVLSDVKSTYINNILKLSPNYLMETYNAVAEKLPGEDRDGVYHVLIKVDPFDALDGPVVRVLPKIRNDEWLLLTKLENIFALYREGKRGVRMDISGLPRGYRLEFGRPWELKSFMSYVTGYFRFTTKWMFDPCVQFVTPSLQELKFLRCHGPIGGEFSYSKIRDNDGKCGSYIIRQCEREYDTYYIDINTKGKQTETFKITRDRDKWELHMNGTKSFFDKLTDLALAIPTASESLFRIPPSEYYDKTPFLQLCLPSKAKKTDNELSDAQLQSKRVQVFDPKEDLQWYKNSLKECDRGRMIQLQADWIQPKDVKDVLVTLKYIKSEEHFKDFMKLTSTWSRIYSPDFLKMYGLTLTTPYTMVMEYSKCPLNEFLYTLKDKVPLECLLDAVHGLVRGIAYLQEKSLIHGYIRCKYLMVTKYDPKKDLLIAKISDPGLPKLYDRHDLPWIPISHHKNLEEAKYDIYADLWAFATTVWEIFSRGKCIKNLTSDNLNQNYNNYGGILPKPNECPDEIYTVLLDGWSKEEEDKRFNQMAILNLLNSVKESLKPNYSTISYDDRSDDLSSITSDYSNGTEETCLTLVNGSSSSCERSFKKYPMNQENYFSDTPSVLEIPIGKLICKEIIGEGNYGRVQRGELYTHKKGEPIQVAIKTLKSLNLNQSHLNEDFLREIEIMQGLNHPNIVQIITSFRNPVSIVMEYVECGSFIVYLASMKPNLTNEKLLLFALDIAKGMEYLCSKSVIHRDLAARNVLVDSDRVKISDFGLAQVANNDGYYLAKSSRLIPIKWYAPESIATNKFSFQSDVWSFGVTLFEMFSRGEVPNLDFDTELSQTELFQTEFLNRLERGERLHRPALCPQNVYDKLMLPCWREVPKARPSFTEIIEIIKSIKNESGERIQRQQSVANAFI